MQSIKTKKLEVVTPQLNSNQLSSTMEEQEEEEHHQHKYTESQTPHFFKIILHDTLQSKKLVIPKSFVRKYRIDLCSDRVYLKVGSGDVWEVELHKEEDGDMWLLDGWQDFLEFYDIKFGYFIVFRYLGDSEFQIVIFDKTTSEIKYPCKSEINNQHNADVGPCLLSVKPEMEESDAVMLVDHNASEMNNRENNTDRTGRGSRDYDYVNEELGTSKRLTPNKYNEHPEAILRTRGFNSPNPCFRIIMRSTYVDKNYNLWLPGRFIRDHIGQKKYLKLSVSCGRFWVVKCLFRMRNNHPDARLQQGWRHFVRDNNLVLGDVCIFELIDSVEVHFQVTIFRAAKDTSFSHCPVKSELEECNERLVSWKPPCHEASCSDTQYATTSNLTSKHPSFKLVMTEARAKSRKVPIRGAFLKHLEPRPQVVTLEVSGRLWRVKVCFCKQRRHAREGIFSSGWSKFARENSLQVGDICIFELIEREEAVLKVSIHKGSTWVSSDSRSNTS